MNKKADILSGPIVDAITKGVNSWAKAHPKGWNWFKGGLRFGGAGLAALPVGALVKGRVAATAGSPDAFGPEGSYLNTLNPVSSVFGGVDKVPESFMKLFPDTTAGRSTAHLTFKSGAVGLLAAALVGGYRAARHESEMEELEEADRPAKDLAGQLSTTFSGDLMSDKKKKQKKTASSDVRPGFFSWQNFFGTAAPLSAMLLASSLAYKVTDDYYDDKRNKALDEAIAAKESAIKQLIAARARMAKGLGTKSELNEATEDLGNKDVYVKSASQDKKAILGLNDLVQHFGALTSAVILASAIGTHAYTAASDEDNIKYKAYKKALREYAKNKSGMTPITIAPTDSKAYFDYINGDTANKAKSVRDLPAVNTDTFNQPISVSF